MRGPGKPCEEAPSKITHPAFLRCSRASALARSNAKWSVLCSTASRYLVRPPDVLWRALYLALGSIYLTQARVLLLRGLILKNAELSQKVLIALLTDKVAKGKGMRRGAGSQLTWPGGSCWGEFNAHDRFAANKIVQGPDFTLGYVGLDLQQFQRLRLLAEFSKVG